VLAPNRSQALLVLSGPVFTKAPNAPLAGVLKLTTDIDTRVSVSVDDGSQTWAHDFFDFAKEHSIPLYGFRPSRTNSITVTLYDTQRNAITVAEPTVFTSPALPADFPVITLLQSQPDRMEPGYTLFRVAVSGARKAYDVIVDDSGKVVWYRAVPSGSGLDIRRLEDGNLLTFSATNFAEINLLGNTLRSWGVPTNFRIDNHEGLFTDHGTILYISTASTVVSNYPTSAINPNAPTRTATNVVYGRIVELSATNSALLNWWSMIAMLDPRRITYMTTLGPSVYDSEHCNSVVEDPSDGSIIVSLRHQNAVVKFSRAGQLIWILGPHENWGPEWQPYLLTPVGSPFAWQYGQHAALLTSEGTVLIYDNGNYRATPFDPPVADKSNYSRAVEYQVNEAAMEVSQVWDYGSDVSERLYTDRVGNVEPMPETGNMLVDFGSVRYVNGVPPSSYGSSATMGRIKEVTHDAAQEVVFDLAVTEYNNPNNPYKDCYVYRTWRIPDLYGHPPLPVSGLMATSEPGSTRLEFSADPARTYTVEATTDLTNWEEIGVASLNTEVGYFQFEDVEADSLPFRYYRVVTH